MKSSDLSERRGYKQAVEFHSAVSPVSRTNSSHNLFPNMFVLFSNTQQDFRLVLSVLPANPQSQMTILNLLNSIPNALKPIEQYLCYFLPRQIPKSLPFLILSHILSHTEKLCEKHTSDGVSILSGSSRISALVYYMISMEIKQDADWHHYTKGDEKKRNSHFQSIWRQQVIMYHMVGN